MNGTLFLLTEKNFNDGSSWFFYGGYKNILRIAGAITAIRKVG
jgi:hypothetical protein